jgi:hypothetical protein
VEGFDDDASATLADVVPKGAAPRNMFTPELVVTARSARESPLKSATTTDSGFGLVP